MPNVEFKRKARLSRQEVADRLIALGHAFAKGSEIELSSGGDTLKLGVASQLNWELEIEIDGDETELEIEIKWTDDPEMTSAPVPSEPATQVTAADPPPTPENPTPVRRGRSRKAAPPS